MKFRVFVSGEMREELDYSSDLSVLEEEAKKGNKRAKCFLGFRFFYGWSVCKTSLFLFIDFKNLEYSPTFYSNSNSSFFYGLRVGREQF